MIPSSASQRAKLRDLFAVHILMRANELRAAGIGPQTIARAVEDGELERISRGLYQRRDAEIEEHQILAEAAIRVPKGVIALTSALAFHDLTDQMPRRVWVAIGTSDWAPVESYPPLRIVRFTDRYLRQGVEHHEIAGVSVPVYSVTKTLADAFRNSKTRSWSIVRSPSKACAQRSPSARRRPA